MDIAYKGQYDARNYNVMDDISISKRGGSVMIVSYFWELLFLLIFCEDVGL